MVLRRLTSRRIEGAVMWADGQPASDLVVGGAIDDPRGAIPAVVPATTAADGRFAVDLYDGLRYRLLVRQGSRIVHWVEVMPGDDPLVITLQQP